MKIEPDLVFSPVPLQTDKHLFIVDRFITEYEKIQLRQRVMKEVFGLNSSVINIDKIMKIIEKYAKLQDKQALANALQDYFLTQESESGGVEQKKDYVLSDLITPDMIVLRDKVESWQEALSIASEPLVKKGKITEAYVEAMQAQYPNISPYIVLRTNIAIPHASPDDGVNSIGMSLLKLKEGLKFDESNKVHLIVVIAAVDKNQHFTALRQLLKLSGANEEIDKIIHLDHEDDIYKIIQAYSK
jgi:mannitol/fructose-specific phosphotransferase system IIA component (Ntr-type)